MRSCTSWPVSGASRMVRSANTSVALPPGPTTGGPKALSWKLPAYRAVPRGREWLDDGSGHEFMDAPSVLSISSEWC
jgi:hypothetical protein